MKKYWEFWLDERERSVRMSYIVLVQTVVIVALAYALLRIYVSPKPIYIISPEKHAGIVYPNRYTDDIIKDFVGNYLSLAYTYTPGSVKSNLYRALDYLVPKLYANTKYQFDSTIESSKQQNVSSAIFFNRDDIKVEKTGKGFWTVTVPATVVNYFGTNSIKRRVLFKIVVKRGNPSDKNLYGLYIYSLTLKEESEQ